MKKLLVITSSFPKWQNDTEGTFVKELSSRLTKVFDVHVLAPYSENSLTYEVMGGLNVYRFKYWFNRNLLTDGAVMANLKRNKNFYFQIFPLFLFQFISLARLIKKQNIKIVHAHWLVPQALTCVIYKKICNPKIKILATVHGSDINKLKHLFKGRLIKYILKNIDELTVVSNAIKQDVLKIGYSKNISVYPMGVDTDLFSPYKKINNFKHKLNIQGLIILFVGGIIEAKGLRNLITAIPEIIDVNPSAKFIIVGEGNLKQEMIGLCKKLNIDDNVVFTGKVPNEELPEYYNLADLFILPSYSEGFGLVYAEAMSCETLTIASPLPQVKDIIKDNETGFFLEENTPEKIAEKINFILENLNDFEPIKKKAREYVVNHFDWKIVTKNYMKLIDELITK